MSEIRPTQSRPEPHRVQNERPDKVAHQPHHEQMQRVEAKREVVQQASAMANIETRKNFEWSFAFDPRFHTKQMLFVKSLRARGCAPRRTRAR